MTGRDDRSWMKEASDKALEDIKSRFFPESEEDKHTIYVVGPYMKGLR